MVPTGNATKDGACLLDEVMGEGQAETWLNLNLMNGGVSVCTPWVFLLAYPKREDARTLYVAYLYGDRRSVADVSKWILETGLFERVEFRKNFLKSSRAEGPWVYDRRLVERLVRMSRKKESRA